MADNPTTRNRFRQQQTNGNFNLWGDLLNTDVIKLVDESLDGLASIAVNANVALTSVNYATDQSRMRTLRFTGAGGFDVTIPAVSKNYIIHNQCALAVNVWTGAGLKVPCAANSCTKIMTDGVDCYAVTIGSTADGYDPASRLILNGDGAIDQPNAGAAVAYVGSNIYGSDGSILVGSGAGRFNIVSGPSGGLFNSTCLARNSRKITVTTAAAAPGAGDHYSVQHRIEGRRWGRLGYSFANARPAIVRIIGIANAAFTLTGAIINAAANRSFPFSSAVPANQIVDLQIAVPGDITGTWLSDTGIGAFVVLSLGLGATLGGVAGAWVAADKRGVAGAGLMANAGNTFEYVLDIIPGTVAPPIYLPPDPQLELFRCMREYEKSFPQHVAPTNTAGSGNTLTAVQSLGAGVTAYAYLRYKARKRTNPAISTYNPSAANGHWRCQSNGTDAVSLGLLYGGEADCTFQYTTAPGSAAGFLSNVHWVADARL